MATDAYVTPYLDSSVFIAWINKEVVDGVDRFAIADHIIKNAESGEYLIYISALTLSEVHKLPRGGKPPLTKEQDEMIIRFFQRDCFRVLPVDRDIGETANRFCRDYGIHGNDAIHLACALRAKCDVLLVWDRPLATKVQRQDIRVESPQILGQSHLKLVFGPPAVKNDDAKTEAVEERDPATEPPPLPPTDTAGLRRDVESIPSGAPRTETAEDDAGAKKSAPAGAVAPEGVAGPPANNIDPVREPPRKVQE